MWLIRSRPPSAGRWGTGEGHTKKDVYIRPIPNIRGLGSPLVRGSKASGPLMLTHSGGKASLLLRCLVSLLPGPHPHKRAAQSLTRSCTPASIPKSADVDLARRRSDSLGRDTAAPLLPPGTSLVGPRGTLSLQRLRPPVAFRLHGLSPVGLSPASFCFSDSVLSFLGSSFPLFLVKE